MSLLGIDGSQVVPDARAPHRDPHPDSPRQHECYCRAGAPQPTRSERRESTPVAGSDAICRNRQTPAGLRRARPRHRLTRRAHRSADPSPHRLRVELTLFAAEANTRLDSDGHCPPLSRVEPEPDRLPRRTGVQSGYRGAGTPAVPERRCPQRLIARSPAHLTDRLRSRAATPVAARERRLRRPHPPDSFVVPGSLTSVFSACANGSWRFPPARARTHFSQLATELLRSQQVQRSPAARSRPLLTDQLTGPAGALARRPDLRSVPAWQVRSCCTT